MDVRGNQTVAVASTALLAKQRAERKRLCYKRNKMVA
jgi:hypothetical protein